MGQDWDDTDVVKKKTRKGPQNIIGGMSTDGDRRGRAREEHGEGAVLLEVYGPRGGIAQW